MIKVKSKLKLTRRNKITRPKAKLKKKQRKNS